MKVKIVFSNILTLENLYKRYYCLSILIQCMSSDQDWKKDPNNKFIFPVSSYLYYDFVLYHYVFSNKLPISNNFLINKHIL